MPIYVESRNLDALGGFVAEHQYLIYIPVGEELNYDAWQYIGGFPSDGEGSFLTREIPDGSLFKNAVADRWTTADFPSLDVAAVAIKLEKDASDVTVSDMVDEGYAGTAESIRHRETVSTLNDVNIGGETGNDLWNFLVATANDISNQYTYNAEGFLGVSSVYGPAVNSNSFISSILRLAQDEGYSIGAFNTDANTVGNKTWLGTRGDDVLDGRTTFANGDAAEDLFGGQGADTLIAGTGDSYLVAGDDTVRDTLIGNSGADILVGYFNQANYAESDSMSGGAGNDKFVIIDPGSALKGGIPGINGTPAAPTNFVHGATSSGDAVLIDGGPGHDVLD